MSVTEAEPNRFVTAISAFIFYVVCAMNFAVSHASSFGLGRTFGAQERLLIKIVDFNLGFLTTVLAPNEVCILAFVALVV